jgi:hypothetical protein
MGENSPNLVTPFGCQVGAQIKGKVGGNQGDQIGKIFFLWGFCLIWAVF